MPFLTIVVPQIPAEAKDLFLASWPKVAETMKSEPTLKGLSGGQIVATDGKAVTDFQFLQLFAFETAEDEAAFFSSDLIKTLEARGDSKVERNKITFQTSAFPANSSPKKLTQFSRITIEEGKKDQLRAAWSELTTALGQETWGGQSVGDGPLVGLGLLAWDSLEDAGVAFREPKAAAAMKEWMSLGDAKNVIVEMTRY